MKSDRRVLPLPPESGLSGPNDDNVMFSLKAFAAKAEPTVPATQGAATVDDSGVIDLKKLMANAGPFEDMPPILSPLEAYPFGAPEEATLVPQAFGTAKPAEANPRGKNVKWLAMSFVLVTSAIVTVGVLQMRSAQNAPAPETMRMGQAAAAVDTKTLPSRPVEIVAPPTNSLVVKENTAATTAKDQPPAATALPRAQRPFANPPNRERARQTTSVPKGKTEAAPTPSAPPAEPCDLRCEIDRRMKKK